MNTKAVDRKNLLKLSLVRKGRSTESKFKAADELMSTHPDGLLGDEVRPEQEPPSDTEKAPAEVQVIPLDHLHDNPHNARHIYDPNTVQAMAVAIAAQGQLVPALVAPHPEMQGHYILIDGQYRYRGLRVLGRHEMACIVREVTDEFDMYRLSYVINQERNAQSALDNALAWQQLLQEGTVSTVEAIADSLGISPGTASKTMALLKLPDMVLDKMREKPEQFGASLGYEVYLCSAHLDEDDLKELVEKIARDGLSVRQVAGIRAKLEAGVKRKPKEVSRQYLIKAPDGAEIGVIKNWTETGKVSFEVKLSDPRAREDLIEYLEQRFALAEQPAAS